MLEAFGAEGFERSSLADDARSFGLVPDDDGILRLGPFLPGEDGGTDGYQIFRFTRVDRPGSRS